MQISKLILLAAGASLCQGLVLGKRDIAQVNADFDALEADIIAFDEKVNAFKAAPGLLTALPIAQAATKLDNDVKKTTDDINAIEGKFEDADSAALADRSDGLSTSVAAGLDNLGTAKPQFDDVGVTPVVQQNLATLKASADAFYLALGEHSADAHVDRFNEYKTRINEAYERVNAIFNPAQ